MLLPLSPSMKYIFACWYLPCLWSDQLSCIAPRTEPSPSSKNFVPHVRHSRFLVQTTASRMPRVGGGEEAIVWTMFSDDDAIFQGCHLQQQLPKTVLRLRNPLLLASRHHRNETPSVKSSHPVKLSWIVERYIFHATFGSTSCSTCWAECCAVWRHLLSCVVALLAQTGVHFPWTEIYINYISVFIETSKLGPIERGIVLRWSQSDSWCQDHHHNPPSCKPSSEWYMVSRSSHNPPCRPPSVQ